MSPAGCRKNKANQSQFIRSAFSVLCSAFGLFGGGRVEVLEFEEESVLAANAVKGRDAEVFLYGVEFRQQAEIDKAKIMAASGLFGAIILATVLNYFS